MSRDPPPSVEVSLSNIGDALWRIASALEMLAQRRERSAIRLLREITKHPRILGKADGADLLEQAAELVRKADK